MSDNARPYQLVAASAITAPLVAHYLTEDGPIQRVLCGEKRRGHAHVPAFQPVEAFADPSAFSLCETCSDAARGSTDAACEWCGRAIDRDEQGRWYAVKGAERGYDPLVCDAVADRDDTDHAPTPRGSR